MARAVMKVEDRRFEGDNWPVNFEIPVDKEQAGRWHRYLSAECYRRGWSCSSMRQLERAENSGSKDGKPQLEIVWEVSA
jgi:hypothetical protein